MKDITPSADLGELVVALLKKPHAPVGRDFIERTLNKKRDPVFNRYLSDTLVWLHLMGRIQRDFHKPETHPECTETTVWFWIADVDYDGYINAEPDFTKYHVVEVLGDINKAKPKTVAAPEPQAQAAAESVADEPVDPDQLIGDEPEAEDEEEEETDLDSDPDVAPDLSRLLNRIKPAEVTGKAKTLDVQILEWAAQQTQPWTKDDCRVGVSGPPATFGMRFSYLVKKERIQQGKFNDVPDYYWLADKEGVNGFKSNVKFIEAMYGVKTPPKDRMPSDPVAVPKQPTVEEELKVAGFDTGKMPVSIVRAHKLPPFTDAENIPVLTPSPEFVGVAMCPRGDAQVSPRAMAQTASALAPTFVKGTVIGAKLEVEVDGADPKLVFYSDGRLVIETETLLVKFSPEVMEAMIAFNKRCRVFGG